MGNHFTLIFHMNDVHECSCMQNKGFVSRYQDCGYSIMSQSTQIARIRKRIYFYRAPQPITCLIGAPLTPEITER
jgi:hypothetical protein